MKERDFTGPKGCSIMFKSAINYETKNPVQYKVVVEL